MTANGTGGMRSSLLVRKKVAHGRLFSIVLAAYAAPPLVNSANPWA